MATIPTDRKTPLSFKSKQQFKEAELLPLGLLLRKKPIDAPVTLIYHLRNTEKEVIK